jgi:hypothetical protein
VSSEIATKILAELIVAASAISGYPVPADYPDVALIAHEELEQQACGQPCRVYGWAPPGSIIYLDNRLDLEGNLFAKSILVHELTHYLQQESGKYGQRVSCREWIEREREAYLVQFRWLARAQGSPVAVPPEIGGMPWLVSCQDEPEAGNGGLGG